MFNRFAHTVSGTITTLLVAAGVALLAGCGDLSRSPFVSDSGSAETAQVETGKAASSSGTFSIGFNKPDALGLLTKPADNKNLDKESKKKKVKKNKGGTLGVSFKHKGKVKKDEARVKKANFYVKKGSIDKDVRITLTVFSGTTLGDISIKYGPSGTKFKPPAILTLVVEADVDKETMEKVKIYHTQADGTVTESNFKLVGGGKTWVFIIEVTSFSSEDLDDEGDAVDDEGW